MRDLPALLLIVLALAAAVPAGAVTVEDVLFYIPFEGDLEPRIAAGEATPQVKGEFTFADGYRWQGVLVGGPDMQLTYPAPGNVNPAEGTVMCWVKPVDWEARDGRHHWFFDLRAAQGPGRFILYKYAAWQTFFYVRSDDATIQVAKSNHMWQPGEWTHVAGTWREGENIIYVNGKRTGDAEGIPLTEPQESFRIGSPSGADHPDSVMDELIIFDRALTETEVAAVYGKLSGATEEQELAIGRMREAPTIDARWEPQEWGEAAGVVGLHDTVTGQVMPHPTVFLVGYDDENLYLVTHWAVPPEVADSPVRYSKGPVVAEATERDGALKDDDSVRWILQSVEDGTRYDLGCNPRGVRFDARQGDRSWDPHWRCESAYDENEWVVEAAVPWSALGGAPEDGAQWWLDFRRGWRRLLRADTCWSRQKRGRPGGLATFVGDGPRLQLTGLHGLGSGEVDLAARIFSGRDTEVQLSARTDSGEYRLDETLHISAGDAATVQKQVRLNDETATTLEITATEGAMTVASLRMPFTFRSALEVELLAYPSQQRIAVVLLVPGASQAAGESTVQVRLTRGETVLATRKVSAFDADRSTVEFDLAGEPEADYEVQVTVLRGGEPIGEETLSYTKRPLPEWWGNTIGITDEVPAPWTPLEVEGSRIGCWGREYEFGGGIFPMQITSQGQQLLAAPISLRASIAGKEAEASAPTSEVSQETEGRVRVRCVSSLGGHRVETDGYVEFDGMYYTTLSLRAEADATLDSLAVEIPMRREAATLFYSGDYGTRDTGLTPAERWSHSFKPCLWLGNERVGLQWFAQSTKGWAFEDAAENIVVEPGDDRLTLRLNFVTAPLGMKRGDELSIEFGLHATPVRPFPKGWRNWRMGKTGVPYVNIQPWATGWSVADAYPVAHENARKSFDARLAQGVITFPYLAIQDMAAYTPEYQRFRAEWKTLPSPEPAPPGDRPRAVRTAVCPNARGWQDFFLWALERSIDQVDFRGLYFDVTSPRRCANRHHGCGYQAPDGSRVGEWNILASREMQKRIYVLMKSKRPDSIIMIHSSGSIFMPQLAFCDTMADGENLTTRIPEGNYYEIMPPGKYRAEFMGHPFGYVGTIIPEFARGVPQIDWEQEENLRPVEHLLGMVLVHDAQIWSAYSSMRPYLEAWKAMDEFGWGDELEFLPYWDNAQFLSAEPEGVLASVYRGPGQLMLVVLNNTDEDAQVKLALRPEALGKPAAPDCRLRDAFTGQRHQAAGGTATVPIAARDFVMLVVE